MVELTEQINKRIKEYLVSESTSAEMREVSASMMALPLWSDIGGCIAIKPDGSFVRHEWDTSKIAEENNSAWQLLSLVTGSKKYPELEVLLPRKTRDAEYCSMCKRTGYLILEDHICQNIVCGKCFGLGWITDEIVSLSQLLECKK